MSEPTSDDAEFPGDQDHPVDATPATGGRGAPGPDRGTGRETDDELGIERLVDDPVLHEPVLIVMLSGWIDAAGAATAAAAELGAACETSPIARFDDDMYIDYRARRPTMEVRDGINTNLVWQTTELRAGRSPGGRDVALLVGPEPDMAWHRFARAISRLASELGVTRMVGLGAYPFAAPHTRPPQLSVSSPSPDVLGSVTFARSSVDVPAGMGAALEHAMHARGIPALTVWAQVPHYVSASEYPPASVALLDGLHEACGISIPAPVLRANVDRTLARIDRTIAEDDEHQAMVRRLEELYDASIPEEPPAAAEHPAGGGDDAELEMRSGDEIAQEIQDFLRDQD